MTIEQSHGWLARGTTSAFVIAFCMVCGAATSTCDAAWEEMPPLPEPNAGFIRGVLNDGIVVAGGTKWVDDKKIWLDKIWWLDLQSMKWVAKGTLPHALAYAVTGSWRGGVIIAGGFDGSRARPEVWLLDDKFELRQIHQLKNPTCIAQGGICRDELILVGGALDPAKLETLTATAQAIKLPGGPAKEIAAPDRTPRGIGAGIAFGSNFFFFGGAKSDPVHEVFNLADAWMHDSASGRWKQLRSYPFRARGIAGAALDENHVYLAGGYGGDADDFTDKAFVYDVKENAYTAGVPLPMANYTSLLICGGHLYALGGEPVKKVRTEKCWRISIKELQAKRDLNEPDQEEEAAKLRAETPRQYEFKKAVLGDVLRYLAKDAGIFFFSLPDDDPVGRRLVDFRIQASPFEALESVIRSEGLILTLKGSAWLIQSPKIKGNGK